MNSVEDTVRAATRAYGGIVRELRPLELTPAPAELASDAPHGRGSSGGPRRARPRRSWLAPLAAAAAVLAIGISLVIVKGTPNGRAVPPARPTAATDGVPQYYVDLHQSGTSATSPEGLAVGDTFTGARLATIPPPRHSTFVAITGAADDRTFVAGAEAVTADGDLLPAMTWYLLRIAPGSTPGYRLSRLSIPDMRSWDIQSVALSGSGRELAMASLCCGAKVTGPRVLQIYSVATGKLLHSWSTSTADVFVGSGIVVAGAETRALSWVDGDSFVAFPALEPVSTPGHEGFYGTERLLNVAARGSDLIADSRVVWSAPLSFAKSAAGCVLEVLPLVSADGKTVVCAGITVPGEGTQPRDRMTLRWLAYSTSAPAVARTAFQVTVAASSSAEGYLDVLWASATGGTLIVDWSVDSSGASATAPDHVGMVSNGRFTPLPSVPDLAQGNPRLIIAW